MRRAWSFLTVLGRAAEPNQRTLSWFPVIGVGVGGIVGTAWWAAGHLWPAFLAAAVAVAVDAVVTGFMHLDGLADSADGLLPVVDRTKRLEIMADPRIGAFGAVALVLVLALRTAALAASPPRPLVIAGLWCGSRTLMAVVARAVPYARAEGGAASAFVPSHSDAFSGGGIASWLPLATYGIAVAVILVVVSVGSRGLAVVAGELIAMAAVTWLAIRRIGGFTGDVLGAGGVIAETVGLLVLVAK